MFLWHIIILSDCLDCADVSSVVVVTCPCDNLQVLPPGHHLTLTVPDPLPSPAGDKNL